MDLFRFNFPRQRQQRKQAYRDAGWIQLKMQFGDPNSLGTVFPTMEWFADQGLKFRRDYEPFMLNSNVGRIDYWFKDKDKAMLFKLTFG
jgi:hypothetical protein